MQSAPPPRPATGQPAEFGSRFRAAPVRQACGVNQPCAVRADCRGARTMSVCVLAEAGCRLERTVFGALGPVGGVFESLEPSTTMSRPASTFSLR